MDNRALSLEDVLDQTPENEGLLSYLDLRDKGRMGRANKNLHAFFAYQLSPDHVLKYAFVKPNEVALENFFAAVDLDELKRLLEHRFHNIANLAGRVVTSGTLLTLAFGARDARMCYFLASYFVRAYRSKEAASEEMTRQLNRTFSVDIQAAMEIKDSLISGQLQSLLDTITDVIHREIFIPNAYITNNKYGLSVDLSKAISAFRLGFDALHPKIVGEGMHFRFASILQVFYEYKRRAPAWQGNGYRYALFEDAILSHVLAHVDASDAMMLTQGLMTRTNSQRRLYSLCSPDDEQFYYYDFLKRQSSLFHLDGDYFNITSGLTGQSYSTYARDFSEHPSKALSFLLHYDVNINTALSRFLADYSPSLCFDSVERPDVSR